MIGDMMLYADFPLVRMENMLKVFGDLWPDLQKYAKGEILSGPNRVEIPSQDSDRETQDAIWSLHLQSCFRHC